MPKIRSVAANPIPDLFLPGASRSLSALGGLFRCCHGACTDSVVSTSAAAMRASSAVHPDSHATALYFDLLGWVGYSQSGQTPLHVALMMKHRTVACILIDAGARIDITDNVRTLGA